MTASTGSGRFAQYSALLQLLLATDSHELVPVLVEAAPLVASALGADLVDAFLYDPLSDRLVALNTPQSALAALQRESRLDELALSEGGLAVRVFRDGSAYLTGRANRDPIERKDIVQRLGLMSMLICRVQTQTHAVGVLRAASTQADRFVTADLVFLEAVARWVSLVAGQEVLASVQPDRPTRERQAVSDSGVRRITRRELEVATLVAAGLTNDEIAGRLVLSTGTVSNHVEHILRKLSFRHRVQIATWIVRQGYWTPG